MCRLRPASVSASAYGFVDLPRFSRYSALSRRTALASLSVLTLCAGLVSRPGLLPGLAFLALLVASVSPAGAAEWINTRLRMTVERELRVASDGAIQSVEARTGGGDE